MLKELKITSTTKTMIKEKHNSGKERAKHMHEKYNEGNIISYLFKFDVTIQKLIKDNTYNNTIFYFF